MIIVEELLRKIELAKTYDFGNLKAHQLDLLNQIAKDTQQILDDDEVNWSESLNPILE